MVTKEEITAQVHTSFPVFVASHVTFLRIVKLDFYCSYTVQWHATLYNHGVMIPWPEKKESMLIYREVIQTILPFINPSAACTADRMSPGHLGKAKHSEALTLSPSAAFLPSGYGLGVCFSANSSVPGSCQSFLKVLLLSPSRLTSTCLSKFRLNVTSSVLKKD